MKLNKLLTIAGKPVTLIEDPVQLDLYHPCRAVVQINTQQ